MKSRRSRVLAHFPDVSFVDDLSDFLSPGDGTGQEFFGPGNTEKRFILLHTGRCGSTLLHHHILALDICPPFEIFNRSAADPILRSVNQPLPVDVYTYVTAYRKMMLQEHMNDPTAVVSYSLNPWSLLWVVKNAPQLTEWLFQGSHVVLLHRKNIVRQAVSYVRAITSGKWHSYDTDAGSSDKVDQSALLKKVSKYIDMILWSENAIESEPLCGLLKSASTLRSISYECLIENAPEIASMILSDVGLATNGSQVAGASKIPNRLERSDDLYMEFLRQMPAVLPSGFELTRQFFYERMND